MQTIVDIKPLKPGKVEAYKAFANEITNHYKKEFIDLLNRYGLKTVNTYFHKIGDVDFVIVVHLADDDAQTKLEQFATSTHPMDKWFVEQLDHLHDFDLLNGLSTSAQPIFALNLLEKEVC